MTSGVFRTGMKVVLAAMISCAPAFCLSFSASAFENMGPSSAGDSFGAAGFYGFNMMTWPCAAPCDFVSASVTFDVESLTGTPTLVSSSPSIGIEYDPSGDFPTTLNCGVASDMTLSLGVNTINCTFSGNPYASFTGNSTEWQAFLNITGGTISGGSDDSSTLTLNEASGAPEPGTIALCVAGIAAIAFRRRLIRSN